MHHKTNQPGHPENNKKQDDKQYNIPTSAGPLGAHVFGLHNLITAIDAKNVPDGDRRTALGAILIHCLR